MECVDIADDFDFQKIHMFAITVLKCSKPLSVTKYFSGPEMIIQFFEGTSAAVSASLYGFGLVIT